MRGIPEYIKNIQKLIDATKSGKLEWKKQNSTTYYFSRTSSTGDKSLVSIQILMDSFLPGDLYLLQITNSTTKENVLSIDSSNIELRDKLTELYGEAAYSIERKGIDFFNDLTGGI